MKKERREGGSEGGKEGRKEGRKDVLMGWYDNGMPMSYGCMWRAVRQKTAVNQMSEASLVNETSFSHTIHSLARTFLGFA